MAAPGRSLRFALSAGALLAACAGGVSSPDSTDPRLRTSVVPDASWGRMERNAFSYRIPPGFEALNLQPIDSDVVVHASGESRLHHDYGWYTSAWEPAQHVGGPPPDVVEEMVRIGGRIAQVVSYTENGVLVVRAWWELDRSGAVTSLLLEGSTRDPRVREQLLASLYSVELR